MREDEGEWGGGDAKELEGDAGHVVDIPEELVRRVDEDKEGLVRGSLFEVIKSLDGVGLRGITTNAPEGIRGVEDKPPLVEDMASTGDIVSHVGTGEETKCRTKVVSLTKRRPGGQRNEWIRGGRKGGVSLG